MKSFHLRSLETDFTQSKIVISHMDFP